MVYPFCRYLRASWIRDQTWGEETVLISAACGVALSPRQGLGSGSQIPRGEKHSEEELLEGQGPLLLIFFLSVRAQPWLKAGA